MVLSKTVVPNFKGEWEVRDGEIQVSHRASQKTAISKAKSLALQDASEVIVYNSEGKVVERTNYAEAKKAFDKLKKPSRGRPSGMVH